MEDRYTAIDPVEANELGATDGVFWSRYFFPRTTRLASPPYHYQLFDALDAPYRAFQGTTIPNRYIHANIFRDGAKTSLLRTYTAKRIAYGISRTILWVGSSETAAARSLRWIQRAVTYNRTYADTYKLTKGDVWQPSGGEVMINHGIAEHTVTALATGIHGTARGINIEDYRPDLIVVDDVVDEDNCITPDSREAIINLVYAALRNSLAPASECPEAKLVYLNTPMHPEDASATCARDPLFLNLSFGVLDQVNNLEVAVPAWPDRFPKDEIIREMRSYLELQRLHIWMREKMCQITSTAQQKFKTEWLQYWTVLPEDAYHFIAIDPIPPRVKEDLLKPQQQTDFAAYIHMCRYKGMVFVVDYLVSREEDPDSLVNWLNIKAATFRIRACFVETVAYQKTLQWFLERQIRSGELRHIRIYPFPPKGKERRSKLSRITDAVQNTASSRCLYISKDHSEFLSQYSMYPDIAHDDLLDAFAIGYDASLHIGEGFDSKELQRQEKEEYPRLEMAGGCP